MDPIKLSSPPTLSPTPTTMCSYTLGNLEFSDIFSEWETVLAAILLSSVLTLPAISVYFRITAEKPMRSYFYSCLVKGIVSFLTAGVLVGDYVKFLKLRSGDGCKFERATIPFLAAVLTEVVEIIFDFGRLVLCFQDPGKIDFYQNVRWNSKLLNSSEGGGGSYYGMVMRRFTVFLSLAPFTLLLSITWIFVFVGNFDPKKLLANPLEFFESPSEKAYILIGIAIFVSLSFSCTGAYYLLRMCCPYSSPNSEKSGVGFFWSRFKLIAVDLPSIISTITMRPSSLFIFWSAEFINDVFPFVAGTSAEESLGCLNRRHDGEDAEKQNNAKEGSSCASKHSVQERKEGTITISRILLPSSSRDGEANNPPEDNPNAPSYRIDRVLSPTLEGEITEADWQEFCDKTDEILEPSEELGSRYSSIIFAMSTIVFVAILTLLISIMVSRIEDDIDLDYYDDIIEDDIGPVYSNKSLRGSFDDLTGNELGSQGYYADDDLASKESRWPVIVVIVVACLVLLGLILFCSLVLTKSIFILLALSGSALYWTIWYNVMPMEYIHGNALFPVVLVLSCALAGWACVKSCFRRNFYAEREMVEKLEQLCKDSDQRSAEKNARIEFSLRTEDDRWKNTKIWCCRAGFSRGHSLKSVRGIDFVLLNFGHDDVEEGALSNEEEINCPEIHCVDSGKHGICENDGESSTPNKIIGALDLDERRQTDATISQDDEGLQGSPELDPVEIHRVDSGENGIGENEAEASTPNKIIGHLDLDEREKNEAIISQESEGSQGSPELDPGASACKVTLNNSTNSSCDRNAIGNNGRTNDEKSDNVEQNRTKNYDNQSAIVIKMTSDKEQNIDDEKPYQKPANIDSRHENPALTTTKSSKKMMGDENRTSSERFCENKEDTAVSKEADCEDRGKDTATNAHPTGIVLAVDGESSSELSRDRPISQNETTSHSGDDSKASGTSILNTSIDRIDLECENQELKMQSDKKRIGFPMDGNDGGDLFDGNTSDPAENQKAMESDDRPVMDSTATSVESPSSSKNHSINASTTGRSLRSTKMSSREIWQNINRKKRK